jgi:hypothetical protein
MSDCAYCQGILSSGPPWEPGEGHRLAFDPHQGRLWTVCTSCGRWNLTPMADRWETLESCERAVRDRGVERLRTPHLSLFDVREGELVRVGDPGRSEFVDWRYGPRIFSSTRRPGFLTRLLSGLPAPPPAGYDPYKRVFSMEDESPWLASPFLESAAALKYLFSQIPLAPSCPACLSPLALKPWQFQSLRLLEGPGGLRLLTPCGFCGEDVLPELKSVRPVLRLALGMVTAPLVMRDVARDAARELDAEGGSPGFLAHLTREAPTLGELSLPDRSALLIALDEGAEAEALEAEWKAAEEIAAISDGELSRVPGFEVFRKQILEGDS